MEDATSARQLPSEGLAGVRHVVLVTSGKGGVGKSQMTVVLASAMWRAGLRVGVLDVDLCGPSIPLMLGCQDKKLLQCDGAWLPVVADATPGQDPAAGRLLVASMASILGISSQPGVGSGGGVAWKDPKKTSFVSSLLHQVRWGSLDILLVDLPPGITGEKLTVAKELMGGDLTPPTSVVAITTPQLVALSDVRRELTFWKKREACVLGLVENMSGLCCPACGHSEAVFSQGGGAALASLMAVPLLGCVPLLPELARLAEADDQSGFQAKVERLVTVCEAAGGHGLANVISAVSAHIVADRAGQ